MREVEHWTAYEGNKHVWGSIRVVWESAVTEIYGAGHCPAKYRVSLHPSITLSVIKSSQVTLRQLKGQLH